MKRDQIQDTLSSIDEVLRHSGNIGVRFRVLDLLDNPTQNRTEFEWTPDLFEYRYIEWNTQIERTHYPIWASCLKCGSYWDTNAMEPNLRIHTCHFTQIDEWEEEPHRTTGLIGNYAGAFALSRPTGYSEYPEREIKYEYGMISYAAALNEYMWEHGTLDGFDEDSSIFMRYMNHLPWTHNLDDPRLEQWEH